MRLSFILFIALMLCVWSNAYADKANTARVKAVFEANCKSCHGALFNIMDAKDLAAKGEVQGGENSTIYKRINEADPNKWMPKGKDPLVFEDKQSILVWLNEGYPAFDDDPPPVTGDAQAYGDQLKCAVDDAKKANPFDGRDYLYVAIGNYYKDSAGRLIEAINTHFNSVSLSGGIYLGTYLPCGTDPKSIIRLNIRDLNQSRERIDNAIVDGNYPYFIDRRGIKGQEAVVFYEEELARITGTKTTAFLRGDWLVAVTGQAPIYYDLLFKDVKVKKLEDLEKKVLKVDTFKQLFQTYEAKRAIMQRSHVTIFNRVVDEFRLDFFVGPLSFPGKYWKSYDFTSDDSAQFKNAFAAPFGPVYSFYPKHTAATAFLEGKQFIFDAQELIFQGPNGYLGFAVVDGKENLIDRALTNIAVDPGNVTHPIIGSGLAGEVVAGNISCAHCHSNPAMNSFQDQGRNHVTFSTDFSNEQRNFGKEIFYLDQAQINASLKTTNDAAISAHKIAGAKKTAYAEPEEPMFLTAKAYFEDLDVCDLGRELGFACDEFKIALQHAPNLARLLGLSETLTGKASRVNVQNLAAQIAVDLNLGKAVVFKKKVEPPPVIIPPPVVCKLVIKNVSTYSQRIEEIRFLEKELEGTWINPGGSETYDNVNDASVDACLYFQKDKCLVVKKYHMKKCGTYEIRKGGNGYSQFFEK